MKERNKIKSMTNVEAIAYFKKVLNWAEFIKRHRKLRIAIEQILKNLNE